MEKKTSQRKIESNRQNGLKSTGPKTTEGKRAVRYNALKHGLLAKEVVIDSGDGKENRADFETLLSQLQEDRQPVGMLEELLVEKIASLYWRLARVYRAEKGEIQERFDAVSSQRLADARWLETKPSAPSSLDWDPVTYGIAVLEDIRHDIEEKGRISEDNSEPFLRGGYEPAEVELTELISLTCMTDGPDAEPTGSEILHPDVRTRIIELIDEEMGRLTEQRTRSEAEEELKREAKVPALVLPALPLAVLSLPLKANADKILRYETAVEKQFYRAVNELERLQRRRLVDIVPPPINVELSTQ